jgi:hypothetical protein
MWGGGQTARQSRGSGAAGAVFSERVLAQRPGCVSHRVCLCIVVFVAQGPWVASVSFLFLFFGAVMGWARDKTSIDLGRGHEGGQQRRPTPATAVHHSRVGNAAIPCTQRHATAPLRAVLMWQVQGFLHCDKSTADCLLRQLPAYYQGSAVYTPDTLGALGI